MANNAPESFNFYYRYKWTHQDFEAFQQFLTDVIGGHSEGGVGRAVLGGFGYVSGAGLNLTVDSGISVSASGYFMANSVQSVVPLPAPVGVAKSVKHLVVCRPSITPTNFITEPTVPASSVPLNEELGNHIVVIAGTPSTSPVYDFASTGANDVVLFGVRIAPSGTSFAATDIDTEVRDHLGKNAVFAQNSLAFDDRCRPYLIPGGILGIKPSRPKSPNALGFLYSGASTPSLFPQASGAYVEGDTFLNFKTGGISGADTLSPDFTPTIPTAGNFIVALLTLGTDDKLTVSYGTQGTYTQCKTGILNQVLAGAGCVPSSTNFKICFVIVGSADGTNVTELEAVDARGRGSNFNAGSAKTVRRVTTTQAISATDQIIEADATSANIVLTLPPRAANQGNEYLVDRVDDGSSGFTVTVQRVGADLLENAATSLVMDQGLQSQSYFAGTTFWKVRG